MKKYLEFVDPLDCVTLDDDKNHQNAKKNLEVYGVKNLTDLPKFLQSNYFPIENVELRVYRFDKEWKNGSDSPLKSVSMKNGIKVATLNVWFDQHFFFQERCIEIGRLIQSSDFDIICLQECIKEFSTYLSGQTWFQKSFFTSDINGKTLGSYGCMIISRIPFQCHMYTFPTMMGRSLILGTFLINEHKLKVANVHLESLDSTRLRHAQLYIAQHVLHASSNAILCGDFNFDSDQNWDIRSKPLENDVLSHWGLKTYLDAWKHTRPKESGYTYDSVINTNIQQVERMRYDRILCKLKDFKLLSSDLFANSPFVTKSKKTIYPSDHFGLCAKCYI